MNIHYFIHFSLFFAFSFAQNETEIQRIEKEESYRRAYHGLVVGYDCSTPTEVTSHELDTIEDCEEKMIQQSSKHQSSKQKVLQTFWKVCKLFVLKIED